MSDVTSPYDEVPYASYPYAQSHPSRLATVARLFGMEPPSPTRCRVLELGCASGGNLIPMAVALPESQFVGVDLSARQIAEGQAIAKTLTLKNIELQTQSILDISTELGSFDYIVCHGVFSWVPAEVRAKILALCRDQLTPHGVGYVSYNTYPGWHLRGTVRDMMVFHARKWNTPQERVGHSRALLKFLAQAVPEEKNPYGMFLRSELELLGNKADSYLLHEHLESVNEPMYFHQFDELATAHGLQYLGEADIGVMSAEGFGPQTEGIIGKIATSRVEFEQYMDYLRNRMFRQTLVCHQNVQVDHRIRPERLKGLFLSAQATTQASSAQLLNHEEVKFSNSKRTLGTSSPLLKVALAELNAVFPGSLPFERLVARVQQKIYREPVDAARSERDVRGLAGSLIDCYAKKFLELHGAPAACVAKISERPQVSPLVRLQAEHSNMVTSLLHQLVPLNDIGRQVARLANGQRTCSELLQALTDLVSRGILVIPGQGDADPNALPLQNMLAESLQRSLEQMAREALLTA